MSKDAAIQTQNLHKDFGEIYAVKGVISEFNGVKYLACWDPMEPARAPQFR